MREKIRLDWIFYGLGIVYWIAHSHFQPTTLLCVFYSFFAGFVWMRIPTISRTESVPWNRWMQLLLLVLLMMFSARLVTLKGVETVFVTAISLIHLRAFIFSLSRLRSVSRFFTWIQLALSAIPMVYLFQSGFLPFMVSMQHFGFLMILGGMMSLLPLMFCKFISEPRSHENTAPDL